MKEKSKKIGIIILFVLFVLSAVCLISSCTMKTKTSVNKLASAYAPKNAFYYVPETNSIKSTNLAPINNFNCAELDHWNTSSTLYRLFTISFTPNQTNGNIIGMSLDYISPYTEGFRSFTIIFKGRVYGDINTSPRCDLHGANANTSYHNTFRDIIDLSHERDNLFDVYISTASGSAHTNLNAGITINNLNIFLYAEPTLEHPNITNSFEDRVIYSPSGEFVANADISEQIITQYNNGYYEGYCKGVQNKENEINAVRDSAYQQGKAEGLALADTGDFNEMITAVADTPLKILYNFFNFEILGVNLWVFFTSILSIIIVVFVIKKIK